MKRRPNKDKVFDHVYGVLTDLGYKISGEIGLFKQSLYEEFVYYIDGRRYKEDYLEEFTELVLETLLDDSPAQVTDKVTVPEAAGEDFTVY